MFLFFSQWTTLLKSPHQFFDQFPFESSNNKTLIWGSLCLWFGIVCESIIQIWLISSLSYIKPALDIISPEQIVMIRKESFIALFSSPLIAFFGIYLFTGALHLSLKAFSLSKSPLCYETTLHLVCLVQLPMLFSFIPIFGPWVASIWVFILLFKGLRQVYELPTWFTFLIILMPALLLKFCWNSALQLLALSV